MARRFLTRRRLLAAAAVLLLTGLLAPQAWAWYQFRAAKSALARHHPDQARRALGSCAAVWGGRPAVRLLACRAAWQEDDTEAAVAELRAGQRQLGGADEATALEWALVRAAAGHTGEVEEYLQQRADRSPAEVGPLVWEALAMGYLRVYRSLDAMTCVNHWLKQSPDNVRALELRGQTYVAGKGVVRGAEDFRRVLELDPTRAATRRRLADSLLALGAYEEAAGHLEILAAADPGDPGLASRLARSYNMLGRPEEARRLAEAALAKHPDDGFCLRSLGQTELLARRWPQAEAALRRAAALLPEDYQTQLLLAQVLQEQGKTREAEAQLKVAEATKDRSERLGELTSRKLAEFPLDPALHAEMGSLLISSGQGEVGERWLRTALSLDPNHGPAHAALAAYYAARGDRARAEYHKGRAGDAPKPK